MSTQPLTVSSRALGPVSERIALLDVLRGVALLGILLVNIAAFSGSIFLSPAEAAHLPGASLTEPLDFALVALVEAKFYSLFSFLFGLGFAVISDRAEMHGARPTAVLMRRYFVLLGIGLIHSTLIWFGDILVLYSLLGMVLLLFRRMSTRRLLTWSVAMLLAPIPLYAVFLAALPATAGTGWLTPEKLGWAVHAVTAGRYPDIIPVNIYFNEFNWFRRLVLMFYPRVLGMFLLGFAVVRLRLLHEPSRHLPLLRTCVMWGLIVGLPVSVGWAAVNWHQPMTPLSGVGFAATVLESIGTPALTIGYVASITLAFQRAAWQRVLLYLAPVGRIALTNYLSQSVLGILIFYGFGALGWFMKVSYAQALLIAVAIYAAQVVFSNVYVRYFRQGPAEWVWRRLTYGQGLHPARVLPPVRSRAPFRGNEQ
jgi:uncharacterized protein